MRICIVCKESKDESCFYRRKSNGYYTSECKPCATAKVKARQQKNPEARREYAKKYRIENLELVTAKEKAYKANNKEKVSKYNAQYHLKHKAKMNAKSTQYKIDNPEKVRVMKREDRYKRYHSNPMFNLSVRLRNRLNSALKAKSWKKTNKLSEYLGCTLSELVVYIESKFTEGMSWDNRNEWHIDHIVCLSSASTPEELHKLCHYTNLQPLWAEDNIRKADSIG